MKSVRIEGQTAVDLAFLFGWPAKNPYFEFEMEADGEIYAEYSAGLDYEKDGYTFDWNWKMTDHKCERI